MSFPSLSGVVSKHVGPFFYAIWCSSHRAQKLTSAHLKSSPQSSAENDLFVKEDTESIGKLGQQKSDMIAENLDRMAAAHLAVESHDGDIEKSQSLKKESHFGRKKHQL